MTAVTRTQFLQSDLIDGILNQGRYRLVPINDHEALARALPGTEPGFIPAGAYGPGRRIPPSPVPTLAVTSLLIARPDLPGRVVRDILDVVYDPRFSRDIRYELTEESGRKAGVLPLHRAERRAGGFCRSRSTSSTRFAGAQTMLWTPPRCETCW